MKIPAPSMSPNQVKPSAQMSSSATPIQSTSIASRVISRVSKMAQTAITSALKVALRYNEHLVQYNQPGASYEFTSDRGAMHPDSPKAPTMRGR